MVKTFFIVNVLVLSFIQMIFSQSNQKVWTLHNCIETAFEQSIIYKNIEISFQKKQVQYQTNISFTKPQVSLRFNTPYSISKNENEVFYSTLDQYKFIQSTDQYFNPYLSLSLNKYLPTNGNLSVDLSAYNNRWYSTLREDKNRLVGSASIQYDQPLFKKNDYYYIKEKADLFRISSEFEFVNSKNEFIYEIVNRFYDLVLLQVRIEMGKKSLRENKLNHQLVQEMYRNGRKSELDFLNSEIVLESQKLENNKLNNDYKTSQDNFALFIGIENFENVFFDESITLHAFDINPDDLVSIALSKNPAILKAEIDIKDINLTVKELSGSKNISVDLNSSLNFDNKKDFIPIETTDNFYRWRVGLSFTFPVLDGGNSSSQLRLASLARDHIQQSKIYLRAELTQQINEQINKLASIKKEIEIGERKQTAAEKAYKLAQVRFTTGSLNLREKIESELLYKSSFIGMNESIINYNKTVYQLKKLIGLDLANGE
jgi:outer membrane protein TolC